MQLNKKHFLFAFLIQIVFVACKKDWLDVKPNKSLAVPSTLKDFQALLDNAGALNQNSPGLGEVSSDGHYITDAQWQSFLRDEEYNAYIWGHQRPYVKQNDWVGPYQNIYVANVVLDGIDKIHISNELEAQVLNSIKGQALFIRAKNFYDLAQIYAPPFNLSTATNDLGIPIRIESDINIATQRSSVRKTYDQIVNDLTTAKDLLPTTALYKTRACKPAVFALLARTFLNMEDYDKAASFADSCLAQINTLLDYNLVDSSQNLPFGGYNNQVSKEVLFYAGMNGYISLFPDFNSYIDPNLYSLYDTNDLRRILYFKINSNGTIRFRGSYCDDGYYNFAGLAIDEVYLIQAESLARKGNTASAMNSLNSLLQKRWKSGTFIPLSAVNSTEALNKILIERKKELLLRGIRWNDLRRLNKDSRFAITISRTIGGQTFVLEPNSYKYAFPIPDDIIQQTEMQQNLGW